MARFCFDNLSVVRSKNTTGLGRRSVQSCLASKPLDENQHVWARSNQDTHWRMHLWVLRPTNCFFLKNTKHYLAGSDLVSMTKDSAGPKSRSVVIPVNVEQDDQDSV